MDLVIVSMKALYEELSNSTGSAITASYVFLLNLFDHYDANECLLQWLSEMYLVLKGNCIFKIVKFGSTNC